MVRDLCLEARANLRATLRLVNASNAWSGSEAFSIVACMRTYSLFFVLCLLLLPACGNVCEQMCDAQAEMIEGCLETWDTSWSELSYLDRADFGSRCYAVYGEALSELDEGSPEAVVLEDRCSQDLQTASTDIDCQSLVSIDP